MKNKRVIPLVIGKRSYVILMICVVSAGFAQKSNFRWTVEAMIQFNRAGRTAISPDGNMVAYTVSKPFVDKNRSEYVTHIWVASAKRKENFQFTRGKRSCIQPSFSPDGKSIAFLSSRGRNRYNQIWLIPVCGGEAEQLTETESDINRYEWSPDGAKIVFSMDDPETEKEKAKKKEKLDMVVVDHRIQYSNLYTIAIKREGDENRKVRQLTYGKFHIQSFNWSPDGRTIVFDHQTSPSFNDWVKRDISTVSLDNGRIRSLVSWTGCDWSPMYSPDGKWIAFISDGGNPKWAWAIDGYIMPAQGGKITRLGSTPDRYFWSILSWRKDSKAFFVSESKRTHVLLYSIPIDGDSPEVITPPPGHYSHFSFSRDRDKTAFVFQKPEVMPDVYVSDLRSFKPRQLSQMNYNFSKFPIGRTEIIKWKSFDGLDIEGLLTFPINFMKTRKYPLVLSIHGGPTGVYSQTYTAKPNVYPTQVLAQQGFFIFRPNPRGSSGYGKDFRFANYNDWGGRDGDDLISGVNHLIEIGLAHPDSLCIMGWSYGGYLTSFLITRTTRFKAASIGAGITNLISYVGTSDVHDFVPDYFSTRPWENIEIYKKHSALFHVKAVITPTQFIHGQNDRRVPISQSYELFNALKSTGCSAEMIAYPRTYHRAKEPKFIMDIGKRVLSWFNQHLKKYD